MTPEEIRFKSLQLVCDNLATLCCNNGAAVLAVAKDFETFIASGSTVGQAANSGAAGDITNSEHSNQSAD